MPVSATAIAISWPWRRTSTVIEPASVNLAALPSRLIRIWRSFSWSLHKRRQARLDLLDQPHAPAPDHRLDGAQALVDQRLERELDRPHLHPSGLDLGQVEHGVDQRRAGARRWPGSSRGCRTACSGRSILAAPHDQPREADDRVQRRAQLVAHVGEELGLRAARLLGLLLGRLQRFLGALEVGEIVVGQHPPAIGQRHAPVFENPAVGEAPLGGEARWPGAPRRADG